MAMTDEEKKEKASRKLEKTHRVQARASLVPKVREASP